ncbi:hypothetical protein D3C80_2020280 [compost metagenome]
MELLHIGGGQEKPRRRCCCELRQKIGVRAFPGIAHRQPVDDFDLGRIVVDQQFDWRAALVNFLVESNILPEIPEILGG